MPTDHKVSINNKNRRWKGWVSGLFQATPEVTFKEKSEFPRDNGEVGLGWGVGVEDVQAESKVEPRLPRRWHLCGWKDDAGSRDLSSNLQSPQHACNASLGFVIREAELMTQDFTMECL